MSVDRVDAVVVGAGVVGLAAARELARSGREVLLLEREARHGTGTSARNSEVIHAGLYYPARSLKARLCIEGKTRLYAFCERFAVPHRRCGKLIVASDEAGLARLGEIAARAEALGVPIERLGADAAGTLEPRVACRAALHSPTTGIVDAAALMDALLGDLEAAGGLLATHARVLAISRRASDDALELLVAGENDARDRLLAREVVVTAGHGSWELAAAGPADSVPPRFLARGRYYGYAGAAPFERLVYPVPEAGGLGIHATIDLGGAVRFGPDVEWIEDDDPRFEDTARPAFAEAIARWFPDFDHERLLPGYAGVRPRVHGPGETPADFRIDGPADHGVPGLVQLFGIESPGLTASLAIAGHVRALLDGD